MVVHRHTEKQPNNTHIHTDRKIDSYSKTTSNPNTQSQPSRDTGTQKIALIPRHKKSMHTYISISKKKIVVIKSPRFS